MEKYVILLLSVMIMIMIIIIIIIISATPNLDCTYDENSPKIKNRCHSLAEPISHQRESWLNDFPWIHEDKEHLPSGGALGVVAFISFY